MKKLLLFVCAGLFSVATQAQTTCANATAITASGTFTCPTITGTYPSLASGICFAAPTTTPKAIWYKFTPTANGVISITSAIAANSVSTTDTRLSVLKGTCSAYTCVAANDDVNEAGADYRSAVTDVTVNSGSTYYFVWDNRWANTGFQFQFTFTAATCFKPTNFTYTAAPTLTTAGIGWTAPTVGTPSGYQYEYGVQGFTAGTGTTVNVTTNSASITGLSPNTIYDFYIRTFCGGTDYSAKVGPISFATAFTAADLPYATGFENTSLDFIGWTSASPTGYTGEEWDIYAAGTGSILVQSGANMAISFASPTVTDDSWMISRGVNLTANVPVTFSYYVACYAAAGTTGSGTYEVKVGPTQDIAGMTTAVGLAQTVASMTPSSTLPMAYTQKTATFTPASTGVYYFGFHNTTPANTGTLALFVDSVNIALPLGVGTFDESKFTVFPNPAKNFIQVSNTLDAGINGITITDINGRSVKSMKYVSASTVQVDVNDLSAGVYMMTISSDKGEVTKKIVKN